MQGAKNEIQPCSMCLKSCLGCALCKTYNNIYEWYRLNLTNKHADNTLCCWFASPVL